MDKTPEQLSAGPARGILFAPAPDGRIERQRVQPSANLSPFLHHFWSVRWVLRTPYAAEMLPHPSARMVFEEKGGARHAEIAGVHTGRLAKRLAGKGQGFGIAFRPAMFQPLLGASMASLTDRVVALGDVLGSRATGWARAIHAEPELGGRIALAEEFLGPLLTPLLPEVARVRDLVERMAIDRSLLRVEDASEAFGLEVRALQRCFRRYAGVNPKWVLQRYRLHEAAEQLKGQHPPPLAALAASLGYADQSHFTRDFSRMIGRTPRSFARLQPR